VSGDDDDGAGGSDDGDDDLRRGRSLGSGGSGGRAGSGSEDGEDDDESSSGSGGGDDDEGALEGSDAPLSDLRRDVDERRERAGSGDGDDDFEELFAEMEVGDVDEEAVWAELEGSADEPVVDPDAVTAADAAAGERSAAAGGSGGGGGSVSVVEKSLCHDCPHFADPPETACTHDGTTIEAEVDTGHFRVVDCPVVAEREARDDPSDFSTDHE